MRADQLRDLIALGLEGEVLRKVVEIADRPSRDAIRMRTRRAHVRNTFGVCAEHDAHTTRTEPEQGGTIGGEEKVKEESKKENNTHDTETEEWFEEIWDEYPKRLGANPKKPAKQRFMSLCKRGGVSPEDIARGVLKLAEDARRNGTDPRFIPQMVTWLNQERWKDGQENGRAQGGWGSASASGGHG